MDTTWRRRLDVALLGLGAAALGGGAVLGGVAADGERVTGMWVGAALSDDGAAGVLEVVDYDFGLASDKHGIFRTIPGLTTDSPVSVASASAPDGLAAKTPELIAGEPGIRLKIGDPSITISGRHRYKIGYELPRLAAGGALSWDAVGTDWVVPVAQTEVHVAAPWQFDALQCSSGATGTTGGCELTQPEPGHLVATIGRLDPGEGITIAAVRADSLAAAPVLPAPPLSAPPDPGAGLAKPAGVAMLVGAGASALGSRWVRRRGRERVSTGGVADAAWAGGGGPTSEVLLDQRELTAMATTEFAPPEGITAAQGGVILAEAVQSEHRVAWLIGAAIDGAIDLVEEDGKAVRLVRRPGGPSDTTAILDTAFAGRTELELSAYDPAFAAGWSQVGASLEAWQRDSGLWDPAGDRRRLLVRLSGAALAVVGAAGVIAGSATASRFGSQWLPVIAVAAALAGVGIAATVRGWELRVRTPAGSGLWLRIESFRRFLAASEAVHAEEAAKRGVLREYTAWAVAVGEVDRWARSVAAAGSAIPRDAGLGYVYMAPLLLASTSSASTAPSSSGSGGGGGSVGGGGGGGGGGSW
ncbi:MAG: DUF2207 family protein [Microthrixaceae bacterium]